MRRITAAFSRRDKPAQQPTQATLAPSAQVATKKKSGLFSRSIKSADSQPPLPAGPPLVAPSSSSSSETSSTVRTPDEDIATDVAISTPTSRWPAWMHPRKKSPLDTEPPHPGNVKLIPPLNPAEVKFVVPSGRQNHDDLDTDDDSDGYSSSSSCASPGFPTRILDQPVVLRSQNNLRVMTQNSLVDYPPTLHPLVASSGSKYPRSCNSASALTRLPSLLVTMHKNQLLRRLDARDLSTVEENSLLPFASRSPSHASRHSRRSDPEAIADGKKLVAHSKGLQRWLQRPAFEERAVEWIWLSEGLIYRNVTGTGIAVAELEFTDGVRELAGAEQETPPTSPLPSLDGRSSPSLKPVPRQVKSNVSAMQTVPTKALQKTQAKIVATLPTPKSNQSHSRSNVDDTEDNLPLGVVLQAKRAQEEQQKALLEQQQRQAKEEDRRHKQEEQARKAYADEVLAARLRREQQRSSAYTHSTFETEFRARRSPSEPASASPMRAPRNARPGPSASRPSSVASTGPRRTESAKTITSLAAQKSTVSLSKSARDLPRQRSSERHAPSEASSRPRSNSESRRTLPRSFKPEPPHSAPLLPSTRRSSSQPQIAGYNVPPVHTMPMVPVMMPWSPEFIVPTFPSRASQSSFRNSVVNPRMSVSTDRLSMFMPPPPPLLPPHRTQVQ